LEVERRGRGGEGEETPNWESCWKTPPTRYLSKLRFKLELVLTYLVERSRAIPIISMKFLSVCPCVMDQNQTFLLQILGKNKLFNVIVLKLESFISQELQTRQSKKEMQGTINFSWQSKANVELRAKCRISLATMFVLGEYSSSEVGQYSSGKLRVS
jgi:hypothetical protein